MQFFLRTPLDFDGRSLLRLMLPVSLLALALLLRPYVSALDAEAMTLLTYLPYLLTIVSSGQVSLCIGAPVRFRASGICTRIGLL